MVRRGGRGRTASCAVLTVLLATGLAGCDGGAATNPKSAGRPSALSGGVRTCTDDGAGCTRSGALRWSRPLLDPYRADGSFGDLLAIRPVVTQEDGDPTGILARRDTVYVAAGTQLFALDAATGEPRWSHRFPRTAVAGFGEPRMLAGRLVVPQNLLDDERQYLSVQPRTGDVFTIPLRDGERELAVQDPPAENLFLFTGGIWDRTKTATIRSVDPTTGRTLWRTSVGRYWQLSTHDGVLYLDDYRERADLPEDREHRLQTRAIQRVDLRTGDRLPDIELPRKLWGEHHLSYVTHDEIIVLAEAPADGGTEYAVDQTGRQLDEVPEREAEPDREERDARVRVEGPNGGVRRLVGYADSGARRWTGPRLKAHADLLLTDTTPRLAVALACAPDGIEPSTLTDPFPGLRCTKPRVFAVTW